MNKIKLFGSYLAFIIKRIYWTLRDRRFWMSLALISTFYIWGWLNAHYYFQSPVKEWRCWMCSRIGKNDQNPPLPATLSAQLIPTIPPLAKPTKTEKEIVMSQPHGEDLYKLFFLESTLGKNDGCRKDGKFGGFGVMDRGQVVCYDSFEKSVERAEYWWSKLLVNNTKTVAACLWNTGAPLTKCSYSDTFNSL